jgi:hypothetical protein
MSKKIAKILIISILVFGFYFVSNNSLAEDTTNIEIIPDSPEPASEIEIRAYIDITGAQQVNLEIQECDEKTGICYPDSRKNITMIKIDENTYTATHKLIKSEASYIQYDLVVKTDLAWQKLIDKEKTYLSDSTNNGNGNTNGDGDTPGFEIIAIFLAIIIMIAILDKIKR